MEGPAGGSGRVAVRICGSPGSATAGGTRAAASIRTVSHGGYFARPGGDVVRGNRRDHRSLARYCQVTPDARTGETEATPRPFHPGSGSAVRIATSRGAGGQKRFPGFL